MSGVRFAKLYIYLCQWLSIVALIDASLSELKYKSMWALEALEYM